MGIYALPMLCSFAAVLVLWVIPTLVSSGILRVYAERIIERKLGTTVNFTNIKLIPPSTLICEGIETGRIEPVVDNIRLKRVEVTFNGLYVFADIQKVVIEPHIRLVTDAARIKRPKEKEEEVEGEEVSMRERVKKIRRIQDIKSDRPIMLPDVEIRNGTMEIILEGGHYKLTNVKGFIKGRNGFEFPVVITGESGKNQARIDLMMALSKKGMKIDMNEVSVSPLHVEGSFESSKEGGIKAALDLKEYPFPPELTTFIEKLSGVYFSGAIDATTRFESQEGNLNLFKLEGNLIKYKLKHSAFPLTIQHSGSTAKVLLQQPTENLYKCALEFTNVIVDYGDTRIKGDQLTSSLEYDYDSKMLKGVIVFDGFQMKSERKETTYEVLPTRQMKVSFNMVSGPDKTYTGELNVQIAECDVVRTVMTDEGRKTFKQTMPPVALQFHGDLDLKNGIYKTRESALAIGEIGTITFSVTYQKDGALDSSLNSSSMDFQPFAEIVHNLFGYRLPDVRGKGMLIARVMKSKTDDSGASEIRANGSIKIDGAVLNLTEPALHAEGKTIDISFEAIKTKEMTKLDNCFIQIRDGLIKSGKLNQTIQFLTAKVAADIGADGVANIRNVVLDSNEFGVYTISGTYRKKPEDIALDVSAERVSLIALKRIGMDFADLSPLSLGGTCGFNVKLQKTEKTWLAAGTLNLIDASLGRADVKVEGLNCALPFILGTEQSAAMLNGYISFSKAAYRTIAFENQKLAMTANLNHIETAPFNVRIGDGSVGVSAFVINVDPNQKSAQLAAGVELRAIQFTQALGFVGIKREIPGTMNSKLGPIVFNAVFDTGTRKVRWLDVDVPGEVDVDIFEGKMKIKNIKLLDPLSDLESVRAEFQARNLSMKAMTRTFTEFGLIRDHIDIDGYVDLYKNGEPNEFEFMLDSVETQRRYLDLEAMAAMQTAAGDKRTAENLGKARSILGVEKLYYRAFGFYAQLDRKGLFTLRGKYYKNETPSGDVVEGEYSFDDLRQGKVIDGATEYILIGTHVHRMNVVVGNPRAKTTIEAMKERFAQLKPKEEKKDSTPQK